MECTWNAGAIILEALDGVRLMSCDRVGGYIYHGGITMKAATRIYDQQQKVPVERQWPRRDLDLVPTANTTKNELSKYKFKAMSEEGVGPEVYRTWAEEITHIIQPLVTKATI